MELMELPTTNVGVLDKTMAILHVFTRETNSLSPMEIAAFTHLPVPTVYRLTQAMSEHGLLVKDGQRFRLGMLLLRLGALVAEGIDVRSQALSSLKWLKEQTGENAELQIRHQEARIAVEVVRSPHNLRPFVDIGAPLPLHLGAGGKVLLAWLPPTERKFLIEASAARFASALPFDAVTLEQELEHIRAVGWAVSRGERAAGVSAIAAPIFDVHGRSIAALVLAAPSVRLGIKEQQRFIPLVCEAARRTSNDIGYTEQEHLRNEAATPLGTALHS